MLELSFNENALVFEYEKDDIVNIYNGNDFYNKPIATVESENNFISGNYEKLINELFK